MSTVPFTRSLPYVLREQLQKPGWLRFVIGEVAAVPDAVYVTISQQGAETTVPRLSSYTPTVGEPAYCLAGDSLVLALGAVGGVPPSAGEPGPPGPEGPTGPAGPEGPEGDPGATGPPGPEGPEGDVGPQGPAGATGATGSQGPPGATGSQGPKGDTGNTGTTGAQGPPGATGTQGPQGIQGPQGNPGPTGPSGASTFLSGTGAPTAGIGVDGSIYLDTATGRLYGPKASGAWPGTAFARAIPLAPTYAQLKAG